MEVLSYKYAVLAHSLMALQSVQRPSVGRQTQATGSYCYIFFLTAHCSALPNPLVKFLVLQDRTPICVVIEIEMAAKLGHLMTRLHLARSQSTASASSPAGRIDVPSGHMAVYVGEARKRFVIPTTCLSHPTFVTC
ncbi:hypothetical protein PR202_gb28958 [Eleusine coracana subsp. coracana]|uniref:Uncharacterized protein n=1 Tax=Eleusine coracana subsp. coracana TaxID=191504 RepID=A0AAV5FYQ5_ELECO|nr:hypothetical protein PR202_gb28958 [Eleusine coracana subsp. coracana]